MSEWRFDVLRGGWNGERKTDEGLSIYAHGPRGGKFQFFMAQLTAPLSRVLKNTEISHGVTPNAQVFYTLTELFKAKASLVLISCLKGKVYKH